MSARWVQLKDVLSEDTSRITVDPSAEYPIAGVLGHGRGMLSRNPIAGSETTYKTLRRLKAGQIVFSRLKAFEGAIALVHEEHATMYVSHEFPGFTAVSDAVSTSWLIHLLQSRWLQRKITGLSKGMGARRERLSAENFLGVSIPLPNLAEQRRITVRLDAVARAAAYSSGAVALATAKRAVWDGAAQSSEAPLGSVIDQMSRSRRVDHEATYRMLGVRWYGAGPFVRETVTGVNLKAKTIYDVVEGDLVYNRLFAWKGSFGLVGSDLAGATVSNEFPTFTSRKNRVSAAYVHAWLQRPEVWSVVERQSTGSTPTSRNRFSIDNFLRLPLPLPDLAEQRRIAERLDAIDRVQDAVRRRDALAAALLPAARDEEFSRLVAQAG